MDSKSPKMRIPSRPPDFYFLDHGGSRTDSLPELFDMYIEGFRATPDMDELDDSIYGLIDNLEPTSGLDAARALLPVAAAFAERRERTLDMVDQFASALLLREASTAVPEDHEDKAAMLDLAATSQYQLFTETKTLEDHLSSIELLDEMLVLDLADGLRAQALEHVGGFRTLHYGLTGVRSHIEEASRNVSSSLALTPESSPACLERRGVALLSEAHKLFYATFEPAEATDQDFEAAIGRWQTMIDQVPDSHPGKGSHHVRIAHELSERAVRLGDMPTLKRTQERLDKFLSLYPDDSDGDGGQCHPQRGFILWHQGRLYEAMYDAEGQIEHLEVAVREYQDGLSRIPKDTKGREVWARVSSMSACKLHEKSSVAANLDMAAALMEDWLGYHPQDSPTRREILAGLADVAFAKTQTHREPAALAEGIRRCKEALLKMPPDEPRRKMMEMKLLLMVHADKANKDEPTLDMERIFLDDGEEGGQGSSIPDAGPALFREKFMQQLHRGYSDQDSNETIEETIRLCEDALQKEEASGGGTVTEMLPLGIGFSYLKLWERTRDPTHMKKAIESLGRGSKSGAPDDKDLPLQTLGSYMASWLTYYDSALKGQAKPEDLDRLLSAPDKDSLASAIPELSHLIDDAAFGHLLRWRRTNDEADLDQTVRMWQRSLDGTQSDAGRLRLLFHLGDAYYKKYVARDARSHLDAAIRYFQDGLKISSVSKSPLHAACLNGLGKSYIQRCARTHSIVDMAMGIRGLEGALESCEVDSLEHALFSDDLGQGYMARFKFAHLPGDLNDLDLAMRSYEESMRVLQKHGKSTDGVLLSLSHISRERYNLHQREDDWEKQVQDLRDSLGPDPHDDHIRPHILKELGKAYLAKFQSTRKDEHLDEAIVHFEDALSCDDGTGRPMLDVHEELFKIYAGDKGKWAEAADVASKIMSQVQLMTGWSLEHSDKQWLLRQFTGFASDAAAVALRAGESEKAAKTPAEKALRLLEDGRGVMMNALLGLRSDIEELKREHPREAEEYLKYRDQIDSVKPTMSNPAMSRLPVHQPNYRRTTAEGLKKAIEDIRALPSARFQSFQEAPSVEEMRAVSARGPIVVVNVSQYGCHAIIVKPDGIQAHSLGVTLSEIKAKARLAKDAESLDEDVLKWLWDKIAKPVLTILGFHDALPDGGDHNDDGTTKRRIFWIPTGPLTKLPLHAAGYHCHPSGNLTVMDRVISSYSVSVTGLVQSHASLKKKSYDDDEGEGDPNPDTDIKPKTISIVALDELPNAPEEARRVANICRGMTVDRPVQTTRQKVLELLTASDIFHFAGHGESDPEDPSTSALTLAGADRLTVSDLFDMNLHTRRPFLAFLSACSTGQIREDKLVDEGLHLISAFQIAGFRHVIGTLWEVNDSSCVDVAKIVYKWMHLRGLGHASVSESLHFACRRLRDDWARGEKEKKAQQKEREDAARGQDRDMRALAPMEDDRPLFWVPYVHYGV